MSVCQRTWAWIVALSLLAWVLNVEHPACGDTWYPAWLVCHFGGTSVGIAFYTIEAIAWMWEWASEPGRLLVGLAVVFLIAPILLAVMFPVVAAAGILVGAVGGFFDD